MTKDATIAAILPTLESAEVVVRKLADAGAGRADTYAVLEQHGVIVDLSRRLGVQRFVAATRGDLEAALYERQFPRSRARYLVNELGGDHVLLLLEHVSEPGAVLAVLRAAGADFGATARDSPADGVRQTSLPLRAEVLDVATYLVREGELRIHKEIVTEVERFEVPVVREELVIERIPAGNSAEPEVMRIPLTRQDVNVTRRTVVENEVVIRRERVTEVRHIEETVRREIPSVSQTGEFVLRSDV